MPPDDPPAQDAQPVPPDFLAWADRFNQARGWKTLRGKGGTGNTSPRDHLRKALTPATAAAEKAAAELERTTALCKSLAARIRKTPDGPQKDELQAILDRMTDEMYVAQMSKGAADRLLLARQNALARLESVEGDLRSELGKERDALRDLQRQARRDGPAAPPDPAEARALMDRHDAVQARVNAARDEVLKVDVPDGSPEAEFRAIQTTEFKLLFALLEKAILLFKAGRGAEALAEVQAAEDRLATFAAARRGAQKALVRPSRHPEIDNDIDRARTHIAAIRAAGFDWQANALEVELNTRVMAFDTGRNSAPVAELARPVHAQAETCEALRAPLGAFLNLDAQIRARIALLRELGNAAGADRFLTDWNNNARHSISVETMMGTDLLKAIEVEVRAARDARLAPQNIDPAALKKQVTALKYQWAGMFTGKTLTDTRTGTEKGERADKRIPRAALDEIGIKLMSAEMLLASNSVAALKTANDYVADIARYETAVISNPKDYVKIEKEVARADEIVKRMATKYVLYLPREQGELRARLDRFKEEYPARSPDGALPEAQALAKAAADLKLQVQGLHQRHKQFGYDIGMLNLLLDQMNTLLDGHKVDGTKLSGYDGKLQDQRREAITLADKRDDASLTRASDIVARAIVDAEAALALLYAWNARGRDKDRLDSGGQRRDMTAIEQDALRGQKAAEAEKALREAFKTLAKETAARIKEVRKGYADLRLDKSEVEALALQQDGLVKEAEQSRDYKDATARMTALRDQADRLDASAVELQSFNKLPVDAAARKCADSIRAFLGTVDACEAEIAKKGGAAALQLNPASVKAYFDALRKALPTARIDAMEKGGTDLAALLADRRESALEDALAASGLMPGGGSGGQGRADDKAARALREEVLGHVRALLRAFETSAAIQKFARQTLVTDATLGPARQALLRFQVTCLKSLAA